MMQQYTLTIFFNNIYLQLNMQNQYKILIK